MNKAGRPHTLDDTKRREIAALISAGSGIPDAARYVGCSARTIRREALRNVDFHETLRKAELSAQLVPLQTLRKAASKHWRAAAWMLERINPDRFAKHDPETFRADEIDDAVTSVVEIIVGEIEDPVSQKRIYQRMLEVTRNIARASNEVDRPRRDPKLAQQRLANRAS